MPMSDTDLILVINCGSSSLKYALYNRQDFQELASGLAEALNSADSRITHKQHNADRLVYTQAHLDHQAALNWIVDTLGASWSLQQTLKGIGHRVVHGGEQFKGSSIIDDATIAQIEACIPLAPLHNPPNLMGIKLMRERFPALNQAAVFDTAFHQTMPQRAYLYGIPYALYKDEGVRRYGFHGTSHRYITQEASVRMGKPVDHLNLVIAHLGNGASVCAVANGQSVDTSMGMTPLEGLVMGTRSGDIDPGLFDFLSSKGQTISEINTMLNKESGLLGLSGNSNDMRTLVNAAAQGDARAQLAIDVFCFRLAKYIAAMMTSLTTLDGLIFTGGIGENATLVRAKTIEHLHIMGFELNASLNEHAPRGEACAIYAKQSHPIWIIPTDEEKMIAIDTSALVDALPNE